MKKKDTRFVLLIILAMVFLITAAVGILLPDDIGENNKTAEENIIQQDESDNSQNTNSINENISNSNNVNNTANNILNSTNHNDIDNTNTVDNVINQNITNSNQINSNYSSEQLEKMALDYYEKLNGTRPDYAKATQRTDGKIAIQLYNSIEGYNNTLDWYTIDPNTGKGENIMGEEINLISQDL